MERTIRFTNSDGDEIEAVTFTKPALATRVFETCAKVMQARGIGMELEDERHCVLASNYYDPREVNGPHPDDIAAEEAMIAAERRDAARG